MYTHRSGRPPGLRRVLAKLMLVVATTFTSAALAQAIPAAPPKVATEGNADAGRQVFNQYCYHCHGTDAVQGERARDLRRLTKRYGDERHTIFMKTVSEGRPDKGMPVWVGTISKQALNDIWAFLETVQAQ